MIKPNSLRAKILENYDEHGFRRLSWAELALKLGSTEKYLMRLAAAMSKDGQLPETPEAKAKRLQRSLAAKERAARGLHEGRSNGTPKTPGRGKSDALAGIVGLTGAMERTQRLEILSSIAKTGIDIAKIQAITKLEEFERAAGTSYGPPPATTKEDVIRLLLEILRTTNPDWVKEALEQYNGPNEIPENHQESSVDPISS